MSKRTHTLMAAAAAAVLALGLAGCGEKPQTAGGGAVKKSDGKPWQGTTNGYMAAGWKAGDEGAWQNQLRERNQGQNEYSRTTGP